MIKKTWLEQLLHPLINAETFHQLESAEGPYVLYVTPLLIELGQHEMCDEVIIDTGEQTQIKRTAARDNSSETTIKAIMTSQASRDELLNIATHIINNDGNLHDLQLKTNTIHTQLLINAKGKKQS